MDVENGSSNRKDSESLTPGTDKPESPAEHDYVLKRHGTLDLDPLPSNNPDDPLNWTDRKKNAHLILLGAQNMALTMMAAGIAPGYQSMSEAYGVPVSSISYLTSTQILLFGIAPIFVLPLMKLYGRKPFLTAAALLTSVCNIASGFCKTYGQQMAVRILAALFTSPALVGSAVVSELFFKDQRGSRNGWWAVMFTVGVPTGPFLMGFVDYHVGWQWMPWIFAIIHFVIFVCYLFADETLYFRGDEFEKNGKKVFFKIVKKTHEAISVTEFFGSFMQFKEPRVLIPAFAYGLSFCYTNVLMIVETPEVFGEKFHLNAQQLGLQYMAIIIGCGLGEILSGPLSDWWMRYRTKKRNGVRIIEDRLWVSYMGFVLAMVGDIVWGVTAEHASSWTIKPLVGACISNFGMQIITTPLITYTIDVNYKKSVEIGQFVNFVRQIWGFTGPFYFPPMFHNLGLAGSSGLLIGLIGVVGMGSIVMIHLFGTKHPVDT